MLGAEHSSFEESDGLVVSGRLLGPRAPDLGIAPLKVIGSKSCRAYDAAAGGLLRLRRLAAVTIDTTYSNAEIRHRQSQMGPVDLGMVVCWMKRTTGGGCIESFAARDTIFIATIADRPLTEAATSSPRWNVDHPGTLDSNNQNHALLDGFSRTKLVARCESGLYFLGRLLARACFTFYRPRSQSG